MLHEVEESVKAVQEFLRRSSTLQSDHALRRVCEYLEDLEDAGYADVQVVQEELKYTNSSSSFGGPPTRYELRKRGYSVHTNGQVLSIYTNYCTVSSLGQVRSRVYSYPGGCTAHCSKPGRICQQQQNLRPKRRSRTRLFNRFQQTERSRNSTL